MNKIDQLLKKYCPNGVEWMKLGDIAELANTGIDKKIKENEDKVKLLNYMDVYKNHKITNSIKFMEVTASKKEIESCKVKKFDVFITPTSETIDDLGHATVIEQDIENLLYSYHIMRIRIKDLSLFNPYFIEYLFSSKLLQQEIIKKAQGQTRFGLSKAKWENLLIPWIPLKIQNKIVEILDNFSELEAELEAELEFRNIQYEHYNNKLLDFDNNQSLLRKLTNDNFLNKEVKSYKLKDISKINIGQQLNKELFNNGEYFVYNGGVDPSGKYDKWNVDENHIAISQGGESAGDVKFIKEKFWAGAHCYYIFSNNEEKYNQKYLYYFLKNEQSNLANKANGVAIKGLAKSTLEDFEIKIPSIEIQNRIVNVLEKLETYNKDVNTGLPAELNARKSQYDYYLNKLLTFKTGGGNR